MFFVILFEDEYTYLHLKQTIKSYSLDGSGKSFQDRPEVKVVRKKLTFFYSEGQEFIGLAVMYTEDTVLLVSHDTGYFTK